MSVGRAGGVRGDGFDVSFSEEAPETPAAQAAPAARSSAFPAAHRPALLRPGAAAAIPPAGEPARLLTKKMVGERALAHHVDQGSGSEAGSRPKYEAKVIPGPDREHYLVKLHRRALAPPFETEQNPEAVYLVDRRDGTIAPDAGRAALETRTPGEKAGVKSLGELARPGKTLGETVQTLAPGETLRFTTRENQAFGVGEIRVDPPGALEVKRRTLDSATPGRLGGTSLHEYTLRSPPGALPGAIRVSTGGQAATRDDPDWAFAFAVAIGQ